MGLLDYFFGSSGPAMTCSACTSSFAQMWTAFNGRPEGDALGDDAYRPRSQQLPTTVAAAERVVAIGDLHGDYGKAVRAFRLAGLTDERGKWCGGSTVAVQVGDILDRGDHEVRILIMLERLAREAERDGGKLYLLNGNHETMNVMGDHRYATRGANIEALGFSTWRDFCALMKRRSGCPAQEGQRDPLQERREAAAAATSSTSALYMAQQQPYNWLRSRVYQPGSEIARRFFAARPTVLQVGSTVFVHGGVLPAHVDYGLERINSETQAWMLGGAGAPATAPAFLRGATAVVWARAFSASDERRCDCSTLASVLESIPGARRQVVGHTIQTRGINSACEGRVIRVDVGMSHGCGNGNVEVLEVLQDGQVRRLRERSPSVEVAPAPPRHQPAPSQTHVAHGQDANRAKVAVGSASTAA
ncbi:hypothetical protein TSOC_008764 [Tetrabaena socialis]|uniref:Calcineurin-like phosphoesterase domain-containing protein n=1 Tax=Tetrabaena socialis TaxID=47790 RepID=A0A2J7ZXN2_9CHLO|nr:hypothetical protein TSOC_008764 [Tetrabaena socialis]|eukprot:PNH05029.1 hypothetical protein TSOC_008764 [Tetrabaena socialis]